eukprot:CAMPEP_0202910970 /NCGR_PEP_ID=MMETSP1392-20130828/53584_1 /ASSEMBLY_ACC=CAM_ASM_000868 /TAXON_ID=225041 /ORGANISM="Chlamydomonas chlamydogama, Strain SAG 11-48b" /LENGTH=189 /DNA_ID=CAMNT_0049601293 /DNA_START=71 /DNA_END=636 /DNA_ORIENTATION=-
MKTRDRLQMSHKTILLGAFAALLVAALVPHADGSRVQSTTTQLRRLHQSESVFPFCRCTDYKCSSSPYRLVVSSNVPTPGGSNVTFTIISSGVWSISECYGDLSSSLARVAILARASCAASWSSVLQNGAPPLVLPLFKPYGTQAELKINGLNLNAVTAAGTQIQISLSGACPTLASFLDPAGLMYSFG